MSQNNGHHRHIINPREKQIQVQRVEVPTAYPTSFFVGTAEGGIHHVVGGMTPLAVGALQIAAQLAAHNNADAVQAIAAKATEIALAVLAECERKEAELDATRQ